MHIQQHNATNQVPRSLASSPGGCGLVPRRVWPGNEATCSQALLMQENKKEGKGNFLLFIIILLFLSLTWLEHYLNSVRMGTHQLVHKWPKTELEWFPAMSAGQVQEPVQSGTHVLDHLWDGMETDKVNKNFSGGGCPRSQHCCKEQL